jgi:hypothetical protein
VKTAELVKMLGTNLEPVEAGELRTTLLRAFGVALGSVALICLLWTLLGMPGQMSGIHSASTALASTLAVAVFGAGLLLRSARPGQSPRGPLALIGVVLLGVVSAAITALSVRDHSVWSAMIAGGPWGSCLICIPIFALIPFASLIWALRKGAPTRLTLTGAIAGLVAGSLGAAAVAIHQMGASITFMGLWYGGPIVLCALVGAVLGSRLLRW